MRESGFCLIIVRSTPALKQRECKQHKWCIRFQRQQQKQPTEPLLVEQFAVTASKLAAFVRGLSTDRYGEITQAWTLSGREVIAMLT